VHKKPEYYEISADDGGGSTRLTRLHRGERDIIAGGKKKRLLTKKQLVMRGKEKPNVAKRMLAKCGSNLRVSKGRKIPWGGGRNFLPNQLTNKLKERESVYMVGKGGGKDAQKEGERFVYPHLGGSGP